MTADADWYILTNVLRIIYSPKRNERRTIMTTKRLTAVTEINNSKMRGQTVLAVHIS